MLLDGASQYWAWVIAFVALVACWPLAQVFRHEKLRPLAAYLLFVSVLALVSAAVFWLVLLVAGALVGAGRLEGSGPAAIVILVSLVPGLAAARWVVRRPQVRRMPK